MSYTTLQLLKIIPLDETLRTELLSSYESMDPARQYEISVAATDAFDEYVKYLEDIFYNHILDTIATEGGVITDDIARKSKVMVNEYLTKQNSDVFEHIVQDTAKLDALRAQVSQLIN